MPRKIPRWKPPSRGRIVPRRRPPVKGRTLPKRKVILPKGVKPTKLSTIKGRTSPRMLIGRNAPGSKVKPTKLSTIKRRNPRANPRLDAARRRFGRYAGKRKKPPVRLIRRR